MQILGNNFNFSEFLDRECVKQANELGPKLTPNITKQLSEIRVLSNLAKIGLLKEIKRLKTGQALVLQAPMIPNALKGRQVPILLIPNHLILTRFNSLLPPENIQGIIPPPMKG